MPSLWRHACVCHPGGRRQRRQGPGQVGSAAPEQSVPAQRVLLRHAHRLSERTSVECVHSHFHAPHGRRRLVRSLVCQWPQRCRCGRRGSGRHDHRYYVRRLGRRARRYTRNRPYPRGSQAPDPVCAIPRPRSLSRSEQRHGGGFVRNFTPAGGVGARLPAPCRRPGKPPQTAASGHPAALVFTIARALLAQHVPATRGDAETPCVHTDVGNTPDALRSEWAVICCNGMARAASQYRFCKTRSVCFFFNALNLLSFAVTIVHPRGVWCLPLKTTRGATGVLLFRNKLCLAASTDRFSPNSDTAIMVLDII
eukprot:m.474844 g.474844  ORF g.474844 m.474844 type:complete len:310 (-) comp21682_c0_seq3:46-975(-)